MLNYSLSTKNICFLLPSRASEWARPVLVLGVCGCRGVSDDDGRNYGLEYRVVGRGLRRAGFWNGYDNARSRLSGTTVNSVCLRSETSAKSPARLELEDKNYEMENVSAMLALTGWRVNGVVLLW